MIRKSRMIFESPEKGKPTKPIKEHFTGRNVQTEEGIIFIGKDYLPFEATRQEIEDYVQEVQND